MVFLLSMKTLILILSVGLIFFSSCKNASEANLKEKDPNKSHTTCQLIEKEFINKGGKVTEYKELYLRCSIQDYFIKICESNVDTKTLRKYLNKSISVEMEVREGMWDICTDDPTYAQSRIGTYVVIKKIVN